MADSGRSIFNTRATEKLRSPDDLDKFLRVTNPSVWIVLGACAALLAGMIVWGVFGSVETKVTTNGVILDDKALCWLSSEEVTKIHRGDSALINNRNIQVDTIASLPLSRSEVQEVLKNDYLVTTLMSGDWGYEVTFSGDISGLAQGVPVNVGITTSRIAPISLILGEGA